MGQGRANYSLFRGDRALGFAYERNRLDRQELLTGAQRFLQENDLEAAANLYQQAKQLAPRDAEAQAGLKIIEKLQSGKITRLQMLKQLDQCHPQSGQVGKEERHRPPDAH